MSYFDRHKRRIQASGNNLADSYSRSSAEFVKSSFADSPTYAIVKIDSIDTEVRVIEGKDSTYKKLLFLPNTKKDIGSVVEINTDKWLITDFVDVEILPKAIIQYCNNILKWDDGTGVKERPCIISRSDLVKFDIDENRHDVNLLQGAVYAFTKIDNDTKKISVDQRFVLGSQSYKVVGIDDLTYSKNGVGLIRFSMRIVSKSDQDNFTTGVANNNSQYGGDWL